MHALVILMLALVGLLGLVIIAALIAEATHDRQFRRQAYEGSRSRHPSRVK